MKTFTALIVLALFGTAFGRSRHHHGSRPTEAPHTEQPGSGSDSEEDRSAEKTRAPSTGSRPTKAPHTEPTRSRPTERPHSEPTELPHGPK